jgi:signal transduction histidine kinase/CheY-like chemotaxis protein
MTERGSVEQAILIEQARHINSNLLTSVVGGFLIAVVLVTMFSSIVPEGQLGVWLLANLGLAIARLAVRRTFTSAAPTYENARRCMRYSLFGTIGSGVLWAVTPLFMMPADNVLYQVLLVFAVSMMDVAAMFSFGVHMATFLGFFVPSMSAVLLSLLYLRTSLDLEIAAGIAIFMVVALRFVAAFNRIFLHSLELRFENLALVSQLTVEKEAAVVANLAKSRFLAAASHDLRQPMHALNLYLGTLAGFTLPAAAQRVVGHVQQCADTMDGLFRDLLDISRLDAGAVQPEPADFAIGVLLERIRVEFEPQARARGLRLKVMPSRAYVRTDTALVERILRNFTANAMRYTERGRILIGCRRIGSSLRVAVYDTGPGIAPEHQRAVFEEFFQIGNPNRDRSRGIGLGLAIVERLSRLLNAHITLRSRAGRGSMFAVDLPLVASARATPPVIRRASGDAPLSGAQLVVIDDELPILDAMRGLLEQWGAHVVTARGGEDALAQLASATRVPDALICDFRLADDEDGSATIDAICAEFNEDIPALILTGDTGPDRLWRLKDSGYRVLHKPVDAETLREALGELLGHAQSGV